MTQLIQHSRFATIFFCLILLSGVIMFSQLDNVTMFGTIMQFLPYDALCFVIKLAFSILSVSLLFYTPYKLVSGCFKAKE